MEIPLFPLSSLLLPDGLMQLRIFEARYIDMIKRCFKAESDFAVCLIREGQETGEAAEPYPIGTSVQITDWNTGDDGLLRITICGTQCVRILDTEVMPDQLLLGTVEPIANECPIALEETFRPLADRLEYMLQQLTGYVDYAHKNTNDAVWVSNRLIELLPMPGKDKMVLLQMQCANDRLRILQQIGFN